MGRTGKLDILNMAKIVYKPTCSECGAVIGGEVYGIRLETIAENNKYSLGYRWSVHPSKCWKCGVWFDSIEKDVTDIQVVSE